jgi:TetR/AcrR family transcriptional repressor of nem operon
MSEARGESSDTTRDIMCATHRAVCEHGYADLTMQAIADESSVSKSALHYHYDSKHDLLAAFLDHLYEQWEADLAAAEAESDDPEARLRALFDATLGVDPDADEDLQTAILEIKAQAPYDDAYRERLRRVDERFHDAVRDTIADGVDAGVFRDVDPAVEATFLTSAISGAHTRKAALDLDVESVADSLDAYVDDRLRRGERE